MSAGRRLVLVVCFLFDWLLVTSAQDYCSISRQHTMCRFQGSGCNQIFRGLSSRAKEHVLNKHNELRRRTAKGLTPRQPGASNMKKMMWNDEIEKIAQRWADQCSFGHDDERSKLDGTSVGQNAYISYDSQSSSEADLVSHLTTATQNWFDEVSDPGFHSSGIERYRFDHGTGHYTQVVWADSEELGCGMVYYKDGSWFTSLVVCNYAPAGNFRDSSIYQVGQACSKCPAGYLCEDGLCYNPNGVSQTNTQKIQTTTSGPKMDEDYLDYVGSDDHEDMDYYDEYPNYGWDYGSDWDNWEYTSW